MDEKRPARWLSLLANLGALVGILLIVVQLQQNRDLMRAQIRHDLAMGIVEMLNLPAGNAQLASVLRRGELGEPLTADEQFQFEVRSNALLRYWEDVHYQYRQGLYDEVEYSAQKQAWGATLRRSVGLATYWCKVRTLYSPLFRAELDALLAPGACDRETAYSSPARVADFAALRRGHRIPNSCHFGARPQRYRSHHRSEDGLIAASTSACRRSPVWSA
jgi:hypothetical protein